MLQLRTSLFQISEEMRVGLLKVAALYMLAGKKKSVNDCILEALDAYLSLDDASQPKPAVAKGASRKYTVRMTDEMKANISRTAAKWQLKIGIPIPMNAVVNIAITQYLDQKTEKFS